MSTKKLQITTPIVNSVNGKSGDVILDSLKNPKVLVFTGGTFCSYDGSEDVTVSISRIRVSNHTLSITHPFAPY